MQINLESITKVYDESAGAEPALADISLSIDSGEFFFLLGPSGCGKTTLLRLIAGLLQPTTGRIMFDDKDVTGLSVDRRDTAMVFQGYALWPHMTVLENVEFGPRMRGRDKADCRHIAMEQLGRVQMDEYAERKPNQLSGGQQQRVAVARALAAGTRCLLLDEPLSNLDARLRLHMREELRNLVKGAGMTAVYVTHDQKEALSMADRIAVLNAGHIVQVGAPAEIYDRPATRFVADFLGEANFIEGDVADAGRVDTSAGEIYYEAANNAVEGRNVICCIRPERIRIEDPATAADHRGNKLVATLVANTYLGEIRQFTCRLGNDAGITWRVSMLAHLAPKVEVGDRVLLCFAPEHCVLIDR